MRLGYVGSNETLGRVYATFRLKSLAPERFLQAVEHNLDCLEAILRDNVRNGLLAYRIPSNLIPLASHPLGGLEWEERYGDRLRHIGAIIRTEGVRVSMHPDQYVVLNSPRPAVTDSSVRELDYHARLLDGLGLDADAKIQVHVGGLYGDREASLSRFVDRFGRLSEAVRRRLVIENDDRLFGLTDCLRLHDLSEVPVVLDVFHLECLEGTDRPRGALERARETWGPADGPPLVDYSSQEPGGRRGRHAGTLDENHFKRFLREARGLELDVLLEIRDKEKSAARALRLLTRMPSGAARFK